MTEPPRLGPAFGGSSHSGEDGDPYALWDAAYVLGSLTSAERRDYETHLAACQACSRAVGELSGMPALLAILSPADVTAIDDGGLEPPPMQPKLLDDLLDNVRRRRRRVQWLTWAGSAAAAALLAVGALIAIEPGSVEPAQQSASVQASSLPTATPLSMTAVAPSSVEATVSMTSQSWGTHVALTCTYRAENPDGGHDDAAGDRLAMVAVGRDGVRDQLATWMALEGVTASPTGSTSMPVDAIASVQIVSIDTGDVLLERNF